MGNHFIDFNLNQRPPWMDIDTMSYKIFTRLLPSLVVCLATFFMQAPALANDLSLTTKAFDEGVPTKDNTRQNPPFGANLFSGKFNAQSNSGLDPNYIISVGDQVSLHIWGEVQADETVTVDTQGNIFLPDIGAVKVSGAPAKQLSGIVKNKVRGVYKEGVEVYVNLVTARPITIFVTGPVENPGQYSGSQTDSILTFLHQAGGIIANQGSYRDIRILRQKKTVGQVDLYSFLKWGELPRVHFENGDTILVTAQKGTINVTGDARGNYSFEITNTRSLGREIITYARPHNSVTNIAISGSRNRIPYSTYLDIGQFSRTTIVDGDSINFVTDAPSRTIDVSIEGSHLGNSFYAAKKGTRLNELLDYIAVSPDEADIQNIFIKRKSVAQKQLKNLEESINRLERSTLTAPAKSDGEAKIRAEEAAFIAGFIKNAREIKPDGNVVVSHNGQVSNIILEDGDTIVIPYLSDIIIVSGEVNTPKALVFSTNSNISHYIKNSGGYSERADTQRIMVKKPNGEFKNSSDTQLSPGDEIVVLPKVDTKTLQFAKDIMSIIFQTAVAGKAVGIL